jgi:hypothetical protein
MHVIIDFETLGKAADGLVAYVAYKAFDPFTIQSFDENKEDIKTFKFNYHDASQSSWTTDPVVMSFWRKQDINIVRSMLGNPEEGGSISEFITQFNEFMFSCGFNANRDVIWSRGNTFDITILDRLYTSVGQGAPYPFYRVRDIRTFLDSYNICNNLISKDTQFAGKMIGVELVYNAHDAVDDIAKDITQLQLTIQNLKTK